MVAAVVAWLLWSLISNGRKEEEPAVAPVPAPSVPTVPTLSTVPPTGVQDQPSKPVADTATIPEAATPAASAAELTAQEVSARHLSDPNDTTGINARIEIINSVIGQAVVDNQGSMMAMIERAHGGDDAATLEQARGAMRNVSFVQKYADWRRMRKDARPVNEEVRNNFRDDPSNAVARQSRAVALDPLDREAVGNLAFYMGVVGKSDAALAIATYGLSLPRSPQETGRGCRLAVGRFNAGACRPGARERGCVFRRAGHLAEPVRLLPLAAGATSRLRRGTQAAHRHRLQAHFRSRSIRR